HRTASAEMADDEPRHAHLLGDPLHADAVEAEATNSELLAPARGYGVGRCRGGQRCVEPGIEDGDLWNTWERLAGAAESRERGRVVKRCECRQPLELPLDRVGDEARLYQVCAPVHNAMPHGVRRNEVVDWLRLAVGDEQQLQAR